MRVRERGRECVRARVEVGVRVRVRVMPAIVMPDGHIAPVHACTLHLQS